MMGASKILTVSYGTFSCTLEGFDDPFNTMKAIAEYFRDLAAEDRYFGAEPPTPDAAMLHKIAEREIQRRVEAKIQENGVILRAGDIEAPKAAAPETVAPPLARPQAAPVARTQPQSDVAPAGAEDGIAAKLSRIRNAVSQARHHETAVAPAAAVVAQAADADLADYIEDEVAPAAFGPEAEFTETEFVAPAALTDLSDEFDEVEPDAGFDVPLDPVELIAEPQEPAPFHEMQVVAPEGFDDEDLLDDDLQSLTPAAPQEAVADLEDADLEDEDDLEGLLANLSLAPETTAPRLADQEVIEDLLPEDIAADLAEPAQEEDDDLVGMLAGLDLTPTAETVAQDAREADLPAEAAQEDRFEDSLEDSADDLYPATESGLRLTRPAPASGEDSDALAGIAAALAASASANANTEVSPRNARLDRARARVIKIRRAQPADATPAETLPETPAAAETAAQAETRTAATLSAEAEADLMRELAEVRAEAALTPAEPRTVAPVRPVRPVRPQRVAAAPVSAPTSASTQVAPSALGPETGEESVSRLLAETNSQMEGPESRRRLAAIQHLKAAVAATVAERRAGAAKPINAEDRMDAYRADLSQIVHGDGEAAANRPTPLVLVSEQRIDRRLSAAANGAPVAAPAAAPTAAAVAAPAAPVRPQRVSTRAVAEALDLDEEDDLDDEDDANIFDDSRGFAEFADRLGAQGLPELLEAAAAYSACVEGRPHFSRPQIMRQVAAFDPASGNTREDGLRSFGTLLRKGKIVKVRRGQYALSEGSHYLAEARKLVG